MNACKTGGAAFETLSRRSPFGDHRQKAGDSGQAMQNKDLMNEYVGVLRRALSAVPAHQFAARREVYEQARNSLAAGLRAARPALTAREIAQRRLLLEDCIARVEESAVQSPSPSAASPSKVQLM
jgi:hypothetical protein